MVPELASDMLFFMQEQTVLAESREEQAGQRNRSVRRIAKGKTFPDGKLERLVRIRELLLRRMDASDRFKRMRSSPWAQTIGGAGAYEVSP